MSSPMSAAHAGYNEICMRECNERISDEYEHCRNFYGQGPDGDWCMYGADQNRDACYSSCYVEDESASVGKFSREDRYKGKEVVAEKALG